MTILLVFTLLKGLRRWPWLRKPKSKNRANAKWSA